MSSFIAKIKDIESVDGLNIVKFDFSNYVLSMMSLDLSENIRVGKRVRLGVKPTHIAIAKEFSGEISYSNQLNAKIEDIEIGELLSSIKLDVDGVSFESIITKNSAMKMNLKLGDEVTLFIKASELSILEVYDD